MNVTMPWTVYRTRFVVRARQLTQPLSFVNALGRDYSGQPGDYLIETPAGCRSILPQAMFEDIYVPLDGTPNSVRAERVSEEPDLSLPRRRPAHSVGLDASVDSLAPSDRRPRLAAWSG